jgi:arabinan endo-1,5-alpha-L-arabinosidase
MHSPHKPAHHLLSGWLIMSAVALLFVSACKQDPPPEFVPSGPVIPTNCDTCKNVSAGTVVALADIRDTYPGIASGPPSAWGPYNVHDPSILKVGAYYYCYNTDVAYGRAVEFGTTAGHQIRRSRDLIEWEYRGTAFTDYPILGKKYIEDGGGAPVENLWAPYITKHNDEFRLYYSLASTVSRLSCIGLATAPHPEGPWTEQGLVVTSVPNGVQTNAIDPTILIEADGSQWMYYGSSWDGIYLLELDPATGLSMAPGTQGVRVAHRGVTSGQANGNIEGPEVIYHPGFDKYYLFIAYDWLATKYNVRVVRSDNPQGPFYDYQGNLANSMRDDQPMIIAPYAFGGHSGWQGVSHPSVFKGEDDTFFLAHQGRPANSAAFMVLHVRELFWTEDGWPIASPQRYANVPQPAIQASDLFGDWERIAFSYRIVPGYADEQTNADLQLATPLKLGEDFTLDDTPGSTWAFDAPWLTLSWADGTIEKVHVSHERDWEKGLASTLVFTGFDADGGTVWGKQVN